MDIDEIRAAFPALARTHEGRALAFFDGPAGSQVPRRVIDAIAAYLTRSNANTHGAFLTSRETDAVLDGARAAVADFLGAGDPACVVFGPNMTTLTFALSRALAATWAPGDRVVVTRLDHEANVAPWVRAAADAGAEVVTVPFRADDTTLDLEALEAAVTPRTRLVAVGAASNATGTINPIPRIAAITRAAGARLFVDAVHYAPHAPIDVAAWGCDYVVCSPYKFFGPHAGILWGTREALCAPPAYRVGPAGDALPGRWEVGTQSHEAIAGTAAAIEYLADLGRAAAPAPARDRRAALLAAFEAIAAHERALLVRLLDGLDAIDGVRVWGITDRARLGERVPTVSITCEGVPSSEVARRLGDDGIFVWAGHYYAVGVAEDLGLEPEGMVRIGVLHYNTAAEIDRLLAALAALA